MPGTRECLNLSNTLPALYFPSLCHHKGTMLILLITQACLKQETKKTKKIKLEIKTRCVKKLYDDSESLPFPNCQQTWPV